MARKVGVRCTRLDSGIAKLVKGPVRRRRVFNREARNLGDGLGEKENRLECVLKRGLHAVCAWQAGRSHHINEPGLNFAKFSFCA
jgi:hypothetical protein